MKLKNELQHALTRTAQAKRLINWMWTHEKRVGMFTSLGRKRIISSDLSTLFPEKSSRRTHFLKNSIFPEEKFLNFFVFVELKPIIERHFQFKESRFRRTFFSYSRVNHWKYLLKNCFSNSKKSRFFGSSRVESFSQKLFQVQEIEAQKRLFSSFRVNYWNWKFLVTDQKDLTLVF